MLFTNLYDFCKPILGKHLTLSLSQEIDQCQNTSANIKKRKLVVDCSCKNTYLSIISFFIVNFGEGYHE